MIGAGRTVSPEEQRRSRTLVAALALTAGAFAVAAVVFWPTEPSHISSLILLGGLVPLGGLFLLVRSHLDLAVFGYGLVLWLIVVGQPAVNGDLSTNPMLVPIAAIILLTVVRRDLVWSIVIWIVTSLVALLLVTSPAATPPLPRGIWLVNALVMAAGGLAIIFVAHRQLQFAWQRQQELQDAVSAYDQLIDELQHAADTDPLTRLPNRRALDAVRALPVSAHGPGAVAVIDLDRLKSVNDDHGHAVGDELLRVFAAHLGDRIRRTDMLFRIGGDEFVLVSRTGDAAGLQRWLVARQTEFGTLTVPALPPGVRPQLSAGVVDGVGYTLDAAVAAADALLQQAKERGGGAVVIG